MGLMDLSYKAVPEGGDMVQAVTAGGLSSPGCHGRELKGPSPLLVHAQAVTATPWGPKGQTGGAGLARRAAPRLASAGAEREACAAYASVRASWRSARGAYSPRASRLLRRLGRRGYAHRSGGDRSGRRLRSTLGALLLRLRVRLGIPLLEVRERIARLLRGEYPRRALGGCRTRVRLAKVRAHDLPADTERSSEFLGPERLGGCHSVVTSFRVRVRRTRLPRGIGTSVPSLMRTIHGRRADKRTRVGCGIGGAGCAVHADSVAHAARTRKGYSVRSRTVLQNLYSLRTRCVRKRTFVRGAYACIGDAYANVCSTPPAAPPRVPVATSSRGRAERSELNLRRQRFSPTPS